jgi:hypothetical protein
MFRKTNAAGIFGDIGYPDRGSLVVEQSQQASANWRVFHLVDFFLGHTNRDELDQVPSRIDDPQGGVTGIHLLARHLNNSLEYGIQRKVSYQFQAGTM